MISVTALNIGVTILCVLVAAIILYDFIKTEYNLKKDRRDNTYHGKQS